MNARVLAFALVVLALAALAWTLTRGRSGSDDVVRDAPRAVVDPAVDLRAPDDEPEHRARVASEAETAGGDRAPAAIASSDVARPADDALWVDVVDESGAPVAGLAVELIDRAPWEPVVWGEGISEAHGRARIAVDPARLARRIGTPAVAPRGAFAARWRVGVELWPLPEAPVRLVVPGRAQLAVTVSGTGGAVDVRVQHAESYVLRDPNARDATSKVGVEHRRAEADEGVEFDVEAGVPIVVVARDALTGDELVERPTAPAAGERFALALAFDAGRAVLAGALAATEDELATGPWRWTLFDLERGTRERHPLVVGEGGAFRVGLDDAALASLAEPAWWVLARGWGGNDVRAMVPLAGRRTHGVHELGTLDAGPPPLLVDGRVVDRNGAPWRSASVRVFALPRAAGAAPLALGAQATTDAEGRFEVRARVDPSILWCARVAAASDDDAAPCVEFAAGDRGLELVVDRARVGVRGRVLFDAAAMAGADVSQHLFVMADAIERGSMSIYAVESDGTFRLPATEHGFGVRLRARTGSFIASEPGPFGGLVDGPADDFVEFDLRGVLRIARVQAVDASGAPILATALALPDPGEYAMGGRSLPASPLELALFRPTHRVRFEAPGWRAVDVDDLSGDRTVVFDRRELLVALHWPSAPAELPPDCAFRPWITALDANGNPASAMSLDAEAGAFDERGVARWAVSAPGRYRVGLGLDRLRQGMRSTSHFPAWQRHEIVVRDVEHEQRFELHWDPQPALEQIQREAEREE